ncbi:Sporulation kinase D [Halalkalibacter krulwichiae]|uniref:histidine kinase n=3 Tax=Halalkalibacter krulwichiae TaxID=199441 RepID=A0A1X9MEN2_9BACI|nr:Sporulation kinase D [Halalkalibacter krulwichiae]
MNDSLTDEEKEKFRLSLLLKELERINAIIEEMLLLAKPNKPNFKEQYIEEIIDEIFPLIKHSSENKKIEFSIQLDRQLVMVDSQQLKQVFHNLIRNSVESIQDIGKISIYSQLTTTEYLIYISDNGAGIPGSIQNSIFTPFTTSKDSGTGLGLAIVQRIIDNHSGSIRLISSKEGETIFLIKIPRSLSNKPT